MGRVYAVDKLNVFKQTALLLEGTDSSLTQRYQALFLDLIYSAIQSPIA
jgi:hypothetical protein